MACESEETMSRRPRRNHTPAFKAKVSLAAIKGDLTIAQIVPPTLPRASGCGWAFAEYLNLRGYRDVVTEMRMQVKPSYWKSASICRLRGHSRRFGGLCRMSALPPIATEKRTSIHVGEGQQQTKENQIKLSRHV